MQPTDIGRTEHYLINYQGDTRVMYTDMDPPHDSQGWESLEEAVRKLAEETTELGIAVEEAFKSAASALCGIGAELMQHVMERGLPQGDASIHTRIVHLLRHPALSGEHIRRAAELQHVAASFAHIGEHARTMATYIVALSGSADVEIRHLAQDVYDLLLQVMHQTFVELRGAVIVSNTRDTVTARRLLDEEAELDRLFLAFRRAIEHAIHAHPQRAFMFHQVLLIGGRMEEIGNQVAAICRTILHAPPPYGTMGTAAPVRF
jgi:Na+/phosphate symporter